VKVQLWRSSSEKVLQRAVGRGARWALFLRHPGDQRPGDGSDAPRGAARGVLQPALQGSARRRPFPGTGTYVADRFNFFTIAYNTNLVKANEVPNTYEDLLNPRFAGRVGLEASDVDWFGAVVKSMGEEKGLAFFRKLAAAKPEMRSGHTLMAELGRLG